MTNFSHLKNLDVTNKTAEYPIVQIAGEPTLILKPATEVNKPYFNSVLRRSRRTMQAAKSGFSAKMINENREEDRSLYPKHVVEDWKDVVDNKGKSVKFTPQVCEEFLTALPDWIFDDIRAFCGESANFTGEPIDIEEKLGN